MRPPATLGSMLHTRREALKLRQLTLARLSGVNQGYISTLENDKNYHSQGYGIVPSRDVLAKLAGVLGLDVEQLVVLAEARRRTEGKLA